LGSKGPSLIEQDLVSWLRSAAAAAARKQMAVCARNCGWYQYYSIDSYTSVASVWEALVPALRQKRPAQKPPRRSQKAIPKNANARGAVPQSEIASEL
jgi:hypothetical protein